MSIEKVRSYFQTLGIAERIMEFDVSSATVELVVPQAGRSSPACDQMVAWREWVCTIPPISA